MPASDIVVKGAREHNLRDVDLVLPRNSLICLTGVSGSGKSSLAFDTIYAEGQRRYVESLSSFARHFLGQMPKPDVDLISGLSPAISISQKTSGQNPRSTVGTITEIHDYLRVLFARIGRGHCPKCNREITAQTREQIVQRILQTPAKTKLLLLAPMVRGQKGEYRDLFDDLLKQGFVRARVDGEVVNLSDDLRLDRKLRHYVEVVIDRLTISSGVRGRLAEAVELALNIGKGSLITADAEAQVETPTKSKRRRAPKGDTVYSIDFACTECGISFEPPSPQLFSFNSPHGMCPDCDGLGSRFAFSPELLVPDDSKTFAKGCFELIGTWRELGRWRRHIYQGVADTIERLHGLEDGIVLETPWRDLAPELQHHLLWGTGDEHITFTWRGGNSPMKYGGTFDGIIPELLSKYHSTKSKPQIRKYEKYMGVLPCVSCEGERLNAQARATRLKTTSEAFADKPKLSLPEVCDLPISRAVEFFKQLELDKVQTIIAAEVLKEVRGRLGFLLNVGLDYLTLARTAPTLSGGETQRIRLAGQIGCGLVGVLYILDEPSIGLHARDNDRLVSTLCQLRDMGNTVVVVEHDEDTMWAADHMVDFGPGPGVRGGEVVAQGTPEDIAAEPRSVTGGYLSGRLKIEIPEQRRQLDDRRLRVIGAAQNNLKKVDVEIPLGALVCVTGVSGSGKSSLVNEILVPALRRDLNRGEGTPGAHERIEGLEQLDKLIAIDQSPIGRTPRSNPGTYIKVFDEIRNLFAGLSESKRRGYKPGRFSFNVKGGRCEACEGNGSKKLEMDFLADVWITCTVCEGHRFNRETLQVRFKGKTISEILEMDVQQAIELFENIPKIYDKLRRLHDVGLDYVKIGQASPTLSGGEAQRIKLAKELVKKSTGSTLYLLDEPTTGLHFADIKMLLDVLRGFVDAGNTVLIVEHNLDVIKTADWIIDLGPEGGAEGGNIVALGTPEEVAKEKNSYTGRALAELFKREANRGLSEAKKKSTAKPARAKLATEIKVEGARQHNLKSVDAKIPRDKMTVFCGPSGSGKTSLAMDTIYAEGQRRYVESLSAYARQFVGQMQKPVLDHIEGLSPAIAIEQKNLGHSPRSTVGTVTEIYDYLRILMSRLGTPYCPDCNAPIGTQAVDQIVDKVMQLPEGTRLYLMAPVEVETTQTYAAVWDELRSAGYVRIRVDGTTHTLESPPDIDRRRRHEIQLIIDRVTVSKAAQSRISESIEQALAIGKGLLQVAHAEADTAEQRWPVENFSQHLACDECGRSFEQLAPHNFSFNSQFGWCTACEGLGVEVGANPAALLREGSMTLAEGAIRLWPNVEKELSQRMLAALSAGTRIPIDVPIEQLTAPQRRILYQGTGAEWFDVFPKGKRKKKARPLFRFQFKGLYPALEEASRLSPTFRNRLEHLVEEVECTNCCGSRLRDDAAATRLHGFTIDRLCRMPLGELLRAVKEWKLEKRERKVAGDLIREITSRTEFLIDVGLEYLSINRSAPTLSAGEAQRIRLASQLGSGLCGVLYVLDEPTIGLHPRDNTRLIKAIHKLRDLGNTLLVVEHDREVIAGCDMIMDFGPKAGVNGGEIVARGTPEQVAKRRASVTGPYLSGKKAIAVPSNRRVTPIAEGATPPPVRKKKKVARKANPKRAGRPVQMKYSPPGDGWLTVIGASHNNLCEANAHIPLGAFTVVTGPSGSGKSSLINEVLYNSLAKKLHRAKTTPGAHQRIGGVENINKVIRVDQSPLGNSPSSNPATYTGVFELIRTMFAQLPDAKLRGYTARRFSFNVQGGRCDACDGNGQKCIEMHFLPDVWVECETCEGQRYNPETLAVKYHGQSISDVLEMPCGQAVKLFENIPKIRRILQTLCDVGLDYVNLGQPAPTLSGGEAQRVKLSAELSRPDTGRTLYLLDEPTTGLHFDDLTKLLEVLNRLVDMGNTVVVIEHNLDLIKTADWVIDMGPEAGAGGGQIVIEGTPEDVVAHAGAAISKPKTNEKDADLALLRSYTGEALKSALEAGPLKERKIFDFAEFDKASKGDMDITAVGHNTKMPWEADGRGWHTESRVGRHGEACRWDGKILDKVVDRIQKLGGFSDTDWQSRTVVEISADKKSDGWFFHAITGEAWILKMKFRVARGTFNRTELVERLPLPTLNQMEELPIYSNQPRVKCKSLRGPWQEVQVDAHSWEEINTPEFWQFIEEAVAGFEVFTDRVADRPEDVMPWKKLGQKWHLARKGFRPGVSVKWETEVLEELCELLSDVAPEGQFLWNNQQVVHLLVNGCPDPWVTLHTKRPDNVQISLPTPKGRFPLGSLTSMAAEQEVDANGSTRDVVKLRFRSLEDLHQGDLGQFLRDHLAEVLATATV